MTDALRPTAFLVALTVQHGHTTADYDWHWERVGRDLYRATNGDIVQVVSDTHDGRWLRGRRDVGIYLGHCWFKRADARHIRDALSAGFAREVVP